MYFRGFAVPKVESVNEFLGRMPTFVGHPERLSVLMTNYNSILGVSEGEMRDLVGGRLDVTAHVADSEGLMAASGGQRNVHDAQAAVEKKTRFDGRLFDLAIVYTGLSVFERALQFALALKRHGKASRVVVLTCDCNIDEKVRALEPLLKTGELAAAIWTRECGGQRDMRAILDRLGTVLSP